MSKYPNSGSMSRNKRKEKDTHPEFTGSAEIDGVPYWISAWVKEGRDGKFFSLSFKPKEGMDERTKQSVVAAAERDFPGAKVVRDERRDDLNDEVPF